MLIAENRQLVPLLRPVLATMVRGAVALTAGMGFSAAAVVAASNGERAGRSLYEQGAYLAAAGNCAACHTAEGGEAYGGGVAFHTSFGVVHSTNITSDRVHGIGAWTEAEFIASMQQGIRPGGEHLYPVFPYTHFTKLNRSDLSALFAYVQQIPAAPTPRVPNQLDFPFHFRPLLAVWKWLFFSPGEYVVDPARSRDWNRGAYLVEGLAHCGACHSPRNAIGGAVSDAALTGGSYTDRVGEEGARRLWSAPNITRAEHGIGAWSERDVIDYLHTGQNTFLESFGPMNEVIYGGTATLSLDDVSAMVGYLRSIESAERTSPPRASSAVLGRGRTVYNLHCGTCHLPNGEGDPEMAPRLDRGSLVVQAENPASLINVILYGPQTHAGVAPSRWLKPMAAYQYELDNEEIAVVASYIRQSWHNLAPEVTAEDVARQR